MSVSPAHGGGGGSPFTRTCHTDEVMVGAKVRFGSWIDSVAPRCVKVTNAGGWSGAVRTLTKVGGGGGEHSATIDCPPNQAVSGFSGKGSTYVDRLSFECRPLASGNAFRINDTPGTKGPAGGPGGDAFGPFHCPGNLPVTSLHGRSGSYVDQVSLVCGR